MAPNMRAMHRRGQTNGAELSGEHVGVRQILRAVAVTGALGAESALQSDSLFAQTRATITATAVVSASTVSVQSLERASLLVSEAVQQPTDLTPRASIRDETGPSTITVLVTTATNSTTSLGQASHPTARDSTDVTIPPNVSQPDGDRAALLVTIAYTAN